MGLIQQLRTATQSDNSNGSETEEEHNASVLRQKMRVRSTRPSLSRAAAAATGDGVGTLSHEDPDRQPTQRGVYKCRFQARRGSPSRLGERRIRIG